jgi:ubiquinone biosynthesis UbiH/UbiF/VisC/COQ6 family hydroxylase
VNRIVVVGGGPVGAAAALSAASNLANTEVVLIERGAAPKFPPPDAPFDNRVYALSPDSIALLEKIGVWPRVSSLQPLRVAAIDQMHVWSDAERPDQPLPSIAFSHGAPLAQIVEHHTLVAAMYAELEQSAVELRVGVTVQALKHAEGKYELTLSDGATLNADLLIGADGRQSQVRRLAGIEVALKDYESVGIVANFGCARAHGNIARQWFTPTGVLAYLPLPRQQISIVWSLPNAVARSLPASDTAAFVDAVAAAGHLSLGPLTLTSAVDAIPLQRLSANQAVAPNLALVGDAAHAIHPLAGQGVNLGFGDVQSLIDTLLQRGALSGIGDLAVLRRHARLRAEATVAMGEATDRLQTLFLRNDVVSKWVRRDGFGIFGRSKLLKRLATEYAVRA